MSKIRIGNYQEAIEDDLESHESVQFIDVSGSPRVSVTADGRLEISFDSGVGQMCITPRAGNVIHVRLVL